MPVLPADDDDGLTMDYDSLQKAGSGLGSGAVIVMDDTTCMVRACQRIARFYYKESCGQCTPCREGTGWMYRVLTRIVEGKATLDDLHLLRAPPARSRATPSAPSAKPRPGRCRASCATSGTSSSTPS
jgi:NADH-quinone oxidoreductase subunit F